MFESLYRTAAGRALARVIATPCISKGMGRLMDSKLSTCYIPRFIKQNNIDMSEVAEQPFGSFNAFFTRRLVDGARPIEDGFVSPCDGLLSAYPITDKLKVPVKGYEYSVNELVQGANVPLDGFNGGWCLVFRLTPAHYHRYVRPCDGTYVCSGEIRGIFHTVRPIALQNVPVFKTNTRTYEADACENGTFFQIEVGATMVGRIVNSFAASFKKGDEKGRFEFGGSTIILLLPKDMITLSPAFISDTEIPVRLGQRLDK